MSAPVLRAGVIAVCAGLSLIAPLSAAAAAVAFVVLGIAALAIPRHRRPFDHLARPVEVDIGRLVGLAGFAFAVAGLALVATVDPLSLDPVVFTMAVLIVAGGLLGDAVAGAHADRPLLRSGSLFVLGSTGGLLAYGLSGVLVDTGEFGLPAALYLAGTGALATGLVHSVVTYGEDPVLIVGVGGLLWIFGAIGVDVGAGYVVAAIAFASALGALAYRWGIASIAGMLSGILLGVITLVYGGLAWVLVLFSFFALGGLATKYRYDDKAMRGVAEMDQGARGSRNVLGNSLVAMVAVVGYAGAPSIGAVGGTVFVVVFSGAIATALADTVSSEVGALYDNPRLITTFDRVRAGTDGAVTVQGTLAGIGGAGLIAALTAAAFPTLALAGAVVVWIGGIAGMFADSVFGATVEGVLIGNEGVNVLATLVGALVATVLLVAFGGV